MRSNLGKLGLQDWAMGAAQSLPGFEIVGTLWALCWQGWLGKNGRREAVGWTRFQATSKPGWPAVEQIVDYFKKLG